jgi:ribosomal protein S12 methylthiotransferase
MVEGENLAIGRTYFQAPEVDGLTVLHTSGFSGQEFLEKLEPGTFIQARLVRRNGVDMEAYPIVKENMV